ncbi:G1/S-specific cyclin CLN1 [Nannizzia gypsea CBS 118893]|uniref:G1/S-specific cyclin CLN1 n=1 Tax=Arthroderma gypseum (strain ATCC MYA-4604 / CBS 118893) TaxID=535722 RepID=E4V3B1_ARTGP|nr:G1/S-specific cyclin CLN1 [Nannizzia gypsea CBS 118893]EFR04485.1 G1/S-specific cyclin CLN1 [Nannizzia gypsea CBS 118893]
MAYQRCQTTNFQPCDSYFVESYDQDYVQPQPQVHHHQQPQQPQQSQQPQSHVNPREHARLLARERQYAMADQMSRMATDEYQEDILAHMHAMDNATQPDVDSIDIQTEIQWFMRPYLLDFLIEAHAAFQLLPATLFLTVNLLDRYCSKRVVYKRHYQLVGCAALLIAAKYGDKKDRVPTIKELKSMCCSLYDDDMFIQMEWHVLQTLGWSIGHPTVDSFLQNAVVDTPYDPEVEHLALYIAEISLFHRDFVSKLSSDIARASLALSRCILNRPQASQSDWASNYDSLTLVSLSQYLQKPSHVLARKYSSAHYSRASKLLEQFLARQESITSRTTRPRLRPTGRASPKLHMKLRLGWLLLKRHNARLYHMATSRHLLRRRMMHSVCQEIPNMAKDGSTMLYNCPPSPTPAPTMQYTAQHYEMTDGSAYSHHRLFPQPPTQTFNPVF